jgi:hypothetical protein
VFRSKERNHRDVATILPFIRETSQDAAFEPELIHAMSLAFDEICERLLVPETAAAAREA